MYTQRRSEVELLNYILAIDWVELYCSDRLVSPRLRIREENRMSAFPYKARCRR